MLTSIGKAFTIFMVAFSVFALGVALWAAVEPPMAMDPQTKALVPAYKAKWDKLDAEIRALEKEKKTEIDALNEVVGKMRTGGRPMPFDPADPFGLNKAPETVEQAKAAIRTLTDEDRKLLNTWNERAGTVSTLINDLDITRTQVRAALAEQKRLAEVIVPDAQKTPGAIPFREQAAIAIAAKQESEKRQESLKPVVVNEALRLMSLMKRNEILEKRAEELGK